MQSSSRGQGMGPSISAAIVMLVLGLVIAIAPHLVFNSSVAVIGLLLLVLGVYQLVMALRHRGGSLYGGVILIVLSLLAEGLATILISILPFFLGVLLILFGIYKIRVATADRQYVNVPAWPSVTYGVLIIIAGAVLLLNPFGTAMLAFRFFGAYLIVMALLECADWFRSRQH
ncbi:DUF308 domain-containing protein [Lacticaseibacillus thailandensis]|uniref:Acid-resistance membrane protein n=1 Tax=Lacticaseibacillus thailandensis DSM 22698 = JCM 13996 TaxID=1423810 RepID=A0A0R2C5Z8_9LACO|nr:DUF308 domain-containing protein [Lacticaseibacillus thailandensis]KRM86597.1 hypothetical protein FD19_GL001786 [Lacticaseibacillus thailandensis DSM 22698 = JCM 13996]